MTIEYYINKLSKLRTDKNRSRWSEITCHQAPHKPFLLLSVMDLFAQGILTENFIKPSFELVDTFNTYWESIMPPDTKRNMAYPFPRLQNDEVWKMVPNRGFKGRINIEKIYSMTKLRKTCTGAKFDEPLFKFISQPSTREQLRATVISKYFAKEFRPVVVECGNVNIKAYKYSLKIVRAAEKTVSFGNNEDRKIRDQGFRRAIVTLYDHRCAMCGIRMLTPEGHTVVEAAHVKPWSKSHDDHPTNGMSLCRLCHWSFDEGLMSVGKDYEVLVSKQVTLDQNFPGHILTLSDREIFRPEDQKFWPGQDNLAWHREVKFCRN